MNKRMHKAQTPQETEKKAEQRKEAAINQGLTAIFRDDAGELPDLTKLERRRPRMILWIGAVLVALMVAVIAAIWAGILWGSPFQGVSDKGLQVTIDGPERIALGKETTYFINYKDLASEPLSSAEVRVSFPPDFTLTKADPEPSADGMTWKLGAIPFGGRGTITIKGIFSGALGVQTAIQAVGTYRPGAAKSLFEVLATRQLEYVESVVNGSLELPTKAMPGDKIRLAYHLQNAGESALDQLEARITLPQGFVPEPTSTQTLMDGNLVKVHIGTIEPGASSTIQIVGTFASGASGDLQIHGEVGRVSVDGTFKAAQKSDAAITVLAGDLLIKLVANGSEKDRSVGFGEPLRFAVSYENTSPEEIKGIELRAVIEPVTNVSSSTGAQSVKRNSNDRTIGVDLAHLDQASSGTVSGNAIVWDKKSFGILDRMPAQSDGMIEFTVPTLSAASATADVPFQVSIQATMENVGATPIHRTVKTPPIVFRFRSDATITAEARYFSEEGAPVGAGPLPPVTGQTTSYRIMWKLSKTVHELTNMRVSATLPKNVAWPKIATVSAGDISFDESTRLVNWKLNRVPADVHQATADFDVQLTPSLADAGRFADLCGETRLEATDVAIAEPIIQTKPGLNTDLQNDEGAKSKGVVRKP